MPQDVINDDAQPEDESVTQAAEQAANDEGSGAAVEGIQQGCRGWVELDSRYWHVDALGVSASIEVHRVTAGTPGGDDEQTELLETHEVHYSAEAGERLDDPSSPADALVDGNCRILFGGDEGFEAGQHYRLKMTPRDNPDNARKYIILPVVVDAANIQQIPEDMPAAERQGRQAIADSDTGRQSLPLTLPTTVDRFLRVPDDSASGSAQWTTAAFVMPCADADRPHKVDLRWIHYCNPHDFVYDHLLDLEGGFVNHPDDPGGATNMGVTIATWEGFAQPLFGIVGTVATLRNITEDQVYEISLEGYWRKYRCDEINFCPLAIQYLDFCFNGGANGVRVLQRAVNVVANAQGKQNWKTTVDGGIGPNTVKQTNRIIECGHCEALYIAYREQRLIRYDELVAGNERLRTFLRGWRNRANEFNEF